MLDSGDVVVLVREPPLPGSDVWGILMAPECRAVPPWAGLMELESPPSSNEEFVMSIWSFIAVV